MELKLSLKMFFFPFYLILCCFSFKEAFGNEVNGRNLTSKFLCPNDIECRPGEGGFFLNVGYTKAVGKNDTLHYVITSNGIPSLLVAKTESSQDVKIDWIKFLSTNESMEGAISFISKPSFVFCVLLNRLLEYKDENDTAHIDSKHMSQDDKYWVKHDLSALDWSNSYITSDLKNNMFDLRVNTSHDELLFLPDGSLSFRFYMFGKSGRNKKLPHLEHTMNSAQIDFILDHVNTTFTNSRFALEIALVTSSKSASSMDIVKTKSIDDEHTPGVFELVDWVSDVQNKTANAYIQWKPICYTKKNPAITDLTRAVDYPVIKPNIAKSDLKLMNLAFMYFGKSLYDHTVALSMTNVSFGLSKDKFYNLNKYSVWSAGIGLGNPPEDVISEALIIIILAGVGIPAALILFGSVGVCLKRKHDVRKGYTDLSEDDVAVNV